MKIIIAGDGEVGFHLAKLLSNDRHSITVVDPCQDLIKMIESNSDLLAITGDSTSISVLNSAGIENTDLLISVIHDEQINIVTCALGKKLGAKHTIARINNAEFLTPKNQEIMRSIGIDFLVCAEQIAAEEVIKLLQQPAATEFFDFSDGKLILFMVKLDSNSLVISKSLHEISKAYPNLEFRAVAIHRDGKTIVPKGDDRFREGDLAYVITRPTGIDELLRLGGKQKYDISNVMIIGGGAIGKETALKLEKEYNIKIIETDKERCLALSDVLHNTLIINGDTRNIELLEYEGLRQMDAFIAVTDDTEDNIFSCLLAKRHGVKKVIALVENIDFIDIAQSIGIECIINKKLATASYIVKHTMKTPVNAIKLLSGIDADVVEFVTQKGSRITRAPIRKVKTPEGSVIGGIIRNGQGLIAVGDMQIIEGDKVVVFSLPEALEKVSEYFR